jgi:arachidonate 15-lipoxygenase
MPSLNQSQGHYRYDPSTLKAEGPARIFPHNGADGVVQYIATKFSQNLVDQGQLSAPWILLLEQLEAFTKTADETWLKFATLFADLKIFQSDWFNFTLPPGEQFNSDFMKLRREMGMGLNAATEAAKSVAASPNRLVEQRILFYQALETHGRTRPKLLAIHERDRGLSDTEFARQRLAGPNPAMIYRVQDKDVIATLTHPALTDLVQQNRLFLAEYPLLNLAPAELQVGRYVGSPKAVFQSGDRGLEPIGIQLEAGGKTFTPADGDDWMRAKLFVQVADVTQHELITHLCYTHLAMEAIAISTPRQLPENHPVYRLLRPHLKFLLAINTRGNAILLSEGAAIDNLMAPTRAVSLSLINKAFRQKSFPDYAFPRDIQQRGVTAEFISDFPYRDDAQLLWCAIYNYVSAYLNQYYASDAVVVADSYLQAWAAELGAPLPTRSRSEYAQAPGWIPSAIAQQAGMQIDEFPDYARIPDFPNANHPGQILALQELIDVAAIVIFTSSAQHAAVNFSQFDYFGYAPNSPFAAYTRPDVPVPLSEMLPSAEKELGQMELAFALSGIRFSRLGSSEMIRFVDQGDRKILGHFQADLDAIESEIRSRNQQRIIDSGVDYPYLLPSLIPNSINI